MSLLHTSNCLYSQRQVRGPSLLRMSPLSRSFVLPVPPSSASLHPVLYPTLITIIPVIVLSIIARALQPKISDVFIPAANTTIHTASLPQTFHHVSALHPLSSGLIVADHPTNSLFFLPSEDKLSHPFLENAGGTNESHSVTLRRPGISAFAEYSSLEEIILLVVARHAARDIALLPITHQDSYPYPGEALILANSFNGTRLNSPNSVYVDGDGNIFFSDAYFGLVEDADEFDRKLDDPPGKSYPQCVYYVPARELQRSTEERGTLEPRLLVDRIDRPAGIAVYNERLFISVASPRRPGVVEYRLELVDNTLRAADPVEFYEWTGALHSWGQRSFSGLLGNLVIAEGRLFVGAGDGIAVFDINSRVAGRKPIAWIGANVPPGPPAVAFKDGWLLVGASRRIAKMRVA